MNAAYHVEASEAGLIFSLPDALLFGITLGILYTVYVACASSVLGTRYQKYRPLYVAYLALRRMRRRLRLAPRKAKASRSPKRWRHAMRITASTAADILFCILSAAYTAVFCYRAHFGQLRWYLFCMIALGFFLYKKTVGDRIAALTQSLLALLWQCLRLICALVTYPFRWGAMKAKIAIQKRKQRAAASKKKRVETIQEAKAEVKSWTKTKKERKCQRKRSAFSQKQPSSSSSFSAP